MLTRSACGLKGQKTSEDTADDIYGEDAKEDNPTASNGMPIPNPRTSLSSLLSCRKLRIRGFSRGILRLMHNRGEQQRLHGLQRRSKRMPSKLQTVITAHFSTQVGGSKNQVWRQSQNAEVLEFIATEIVSSSPSFRPITQDIRTTDSSR
jgi:hypothetical protein